MSYYLTQVIVDGLSNNIVNIMHTFVFVLTVRYYLCTIPLFCQHLIFKLFNMLNGWYIKIIITLYKDLQRLS